MNRDSHITAVELDKYGVVRTDNTVRPADKFILIKYKMLRFELWVYYPSLVRRFIVLQTKAHQDLLKKSRRVELDPINEKASYVLLEQLKRTALADLKQLSNSIDKKRSEMRLNTPKKVNNISVGKKLRIKHNSDSVEGKLLFVGVHKKIPLVRLSDKYGQCFQIDGADIVKLTTEHGCAIDDIVRITRKDTDKSENVAQYNILTIKKSHVEIPLHDYMSYEVPEPTNQELIDEYTAVG